VAAARLLLGAVLALSFGIVTDAVAQYPPAPVIAGIEAYNKKDFATAFRLLKGAADAGDSDGQVNLGYLYARGHGVEENQKEALRLYLLSARQNNAEGMNAVGYKYWFGTGIDPDIKQAVHWFCRAAVSGDPRGLNNLGILHSRGEGVPRDVEEFRGLWRQSAERGNPQAMHNLGQSLVIGPDQPLDRQEGMQWLIKAAQLGNAGAQQLVRRMGYSAPLPLPVVETGLAMRVVRTDLPPGKSRYCGAFVS
jgi:TPR repeat protein